MGIYEPLLVNVKIKYIINVFTVVDTVRCVTYRITLDPTDHVRRESSVKLILTRLLI